MPLAREWSIGDDAELNAYIVVASKDEIWKWRTEDDWLSLNDEKG